MWSQPTGSPGSSPRRVGTRSMAESNLTVLTAKKVTCLRKYGRFEDSGRMEGDGQVNKLRARCFLRGAPLWYSLSTQVRRALF